MRAKIQTPVYPTESEQKVGQAIQNIFPLAEKKTVEKNGLEFIEAETQSLKRFTELLEKEKIRASILEVLEKNHSDGKTTIMLSKPAAYSGRARLSEEYPLGAIQLTLICEKSQLRELIYGGEE